MAIPIFNYKNLIMKYARLFWTIICIVLLSTISLIILSFEEAPDVYMWTWFGYKWGINWSSYFTLKMIVILGCLGALIVFQKIEMDNKAKDKHS